MAQKSSIRWGLARGLILTCGAWFVVAPVHAASWLYLATPAPMDIAFFVGGMPADGQSETQPTQVVGTGTAPKDPAVKPVDPMTIPRERIDWHIPDPVVDRARVKAILERAKVADDRAVILYVDRVLSRVDTVRRERQIELTLQDALARALVNSYTIELRSYTPAIEATRVVEAEAAFDAVFFADLTKNIVDRPTGSQLASSDVDMLDIRTGVRKLLPSGAQVSASYGFSRTDTSLSFQQINPEYFNDLALEMRQPLLRGFGFDYNRSIIRVARNDRGIGDLEFAREVRDTLREVEQFYWRLVQARRNLVVSARLLADFESIYDFLWARREFDIIPVQLAATRANLESSRADFVQVRSDLYDAEDRLITAMNDPEITLAERPELIPTDFPTLEGIIVDRLAEAQTALDFRPEIREQELRVDTARILVGRAKNEELPRLDLTFRYTIDGLDRNADSAFDQLTMHRYVEYLVGIQLEVPIGNRGPRAAHHRAKLQHQQAVAQLRLTLDQVLRDVNIAVRRLSTSYDQIGPTYESAESREREVASIVARAERKDINTLNSELGARQSLANERSAMINNIVEYNIAITNLEWAKGTLLHYNNVVIPELGRPHKSETQSTGSGSPP